MTRAVPATPTLHGRDAARVLAEMNNLKLSRAMRIRNARARAAFTAINRRKRRRRSRE